MPWPRHSGSVEPPQIPANSVPSTRASRPEQITWPSASATQNCSSPSIRSSRSSISAPDGPPPKIAAATALASMTRASRSGSRSTRRTVTPVRQVDVDGERTRLADHHRLDLLGLEAVGLEARVEVGRPVVAAGLPLELLDRGVAGEERDGLGDERVDVGDPLAGSRS